MAWPPCSKIRASVAHRTTRRATPVDSRRAWASKAWAEVRERERQSLELLRQQKEHRREKAELDRVAGEHARALAERLRQNEIESVRDTAESLQTALEQMKAVEEMRRTYRELRDRRFDRE